LDRPPSGAFKSSAPRPVLRSIRTVPLTYPDRKAQLDPVAMSNLASKAASVAKSVIGSVSIPTSIDAITGGGLATPKTPADEGIQFFENAVPDKSKPIAVYEIHLDADGGPDKERSVS
jgi:hypothetical protein